MIRVNRYGDLGRHDYGWLDARYHFSFGEYYDPLRTGFGSLRVINDDIIQPGAGFPPHSHKNMEIITFVRQGVVAHKDSLGNTGATPAGDVQVMSAGTGIQHSEYNGDAGVTRLYQIWIEPREKGVAPRWDMATVPKALQDGKLPLLVSGETEDGVLHINADAAIYGGRVPAGAKFRQVVSGRAYALLSAGSASFDGEKLQPGDGLEITETDGVDIAADTDAEIIVIDLAA